MQKLRLTSRDYDIMEDLYHMRVLSVDQIASLWFPGVTSGDFQAARKRLRRLAREGYLKCRYYYSHGPGGARKREGTAYVLTDKGMYAVCRSRDLKYRKAEDNMVQSWRLGVQILVNRIPVLLRECHLPWQWMESREAKARFELPYRNWLSGFLSAPPETGASEVGVYLVPSSLDETALKGLVYDIGLLAKRRLGVEILVLTPGDPYGLRSGLMEMELPVSVLRVLSSKAGLKVLSEFLPDPRSALSAWLGAGLEPASVPPASWQIPGRFCVADCATGDISPVRALQAVGWHGSLPLKVIAPASWKEHLNYPGVEIVPPPPGWDTLVPPVPELAARGDNQEPEEAGDFDENYEETWYRQPDGWTEGVVK